MADRTDPHGNVLPKGIYLRGKQYGALPRVNGKQKWVPLCTEFRDLEVAMIKAGLKMAKPTAAPIKKQGGRTVGELVEAYINDRGPDLSAHTIKGYRRTLKNIERWAGKVPLGKITPPKINQWRQAARMGDKHVTFNHNLRLLRAAFNWGVANGWNKDNPAEKIKILTEKPRRRTATDEEIGRLLEAASPKWQSIIKVAVMTGLRPADIRLMRRSQLTEAGLVITTQKTARDLCIAWTPELREAIADGLATQPEQRPSLYVFPGRSGGAYTNDGFSAVWMRIRDRADCDGLQFRDLRRTAANRAATLADAQALLGHTDAKLTGRVYHTQQQSQAVALFDKESR